MPVQFGEMPKVRTRISPPGQYEEAHREHLKKPTTTKKIEE